MSLYELSIDPSQVREAERVVTVEGREFPTLLVRWESEMFGLKWETTVVRDYVLTLPPLSPGVTFRSVRIAAFVGNTPTKYLYFGTEMTSAVPRVGPEMENICTPQGAFQEFQLDETSCPIPYAKLITAAPRIYGNGAQDYYAPPIKVERYDGTPTTDLLADMFPEMIADLPATPGALLVDPAHGFWEGARYVGVRKIAILRQGVVIGLHRRGGRVERDQVPPEVQRIDPKRDIRQGWVAVDLGARTVTVATRSAKSAPQLLRIGTTDDAVIQADYENPCELTFRNVGGALKSWRDRVILPMTRFDDVRVSQASRQMRSESSNLPAAVAAQAALTELTWSRDRVMSGTPFMLSGVEDGLSTEKLKKPAPPIIDEDGIGAHDPYDPLEMYAYYLGLVVNRPNRGIYLKYAVTMPTGWSEEQRRAGLVSVRRGIFRSLPAGMVDYHDVENLIVEDGGESAINFATNSFRAFSIQCNEGPVNFAVIEAGASETGILFGVYRLANDAERRGGAERAVEYLTPHSMPWFGGERLLHRLAHRLYVGNEELVREHQFVMERAPEEDAPSFSGVDADALTAASPSARANLNVLKDVVRPLLEGDATSRINANVKLYTIDNKLVDVQLKVERVRLKMQLDQWFNKLAEEFVELLKPALSRIARGSDPYEGLRIMLGGRVSMNVKLHDALAKVLPSNVRLHRYREPDKTNVNAPTVKTATVLGVLSRKFDGITAVIRSERRDAFRFRVGRARHGQLADALDPSAEYDEWREMGACSRPDVEIRYMSAEDDGEVAADDPRVRASICALGADAVGMRVYIRAVDTRRVEVAAGPPGGEPDETITTWYLDLTTGQSAPSH